MSELFTNLPSTPDASAAVAQTREPLTESSAPAGSHIKCPGEGVDFEIGAGVERAVHGQPYQRKGDDPLYRPLKIFTLDPSVSRLEGSVALVNVPYEPLKPGPVGKVFIVDDAVDNSDPLIRETFDESQMNRACQINLDDPAVLIRSGRDPSPSDRLFHQQMVYAVCSTVYTAFRKALGRHVAWGFDQTQLRIRPHVQELKGAEYREDKGGGELCFGYYTAVSQENALDRNLPNAPIFTCLSHDIIAHEVTHALLDGLRAHFTFPSGPDVLAFHEAFGDLVALFQHFSYDKVLQTAIQKSRGRLENADLLTNFARQFGYTRGAGKALRSAINIDDLQASDATNTSQIPKPTPKPKSYDPEVGTYELASVLVSAVFEAFNTIFKRKTERYIRLATNGSGTLPLGELSQDLQAVLADEASQLASQFLAMCIRAIDYCPPVDLEFGEFLRAVITADRDLVPDDPWGYREAWIDAFRERHIYPRGVTSLSEDALLWRPPNKQIPIIKKLNFANLRFQGDPACPSGSKELRRQAGVLGKLISDPKYTEPFGLVRPNDQELSKDFDLPCVQSIRSSRRVGPDGQVIFDLIAEVTQRRMVRREDGSEEFDFYGGATVIIDPNGKIRYVISKNVMQPERLNRQRDFLISTTGRQFWKKGEGSDYIPHLQFFGLLHEQ